MSQNVYEELANKKKSLADKLGENTELGNIVLALLGRLIILATERGKPIDGITFAPMLNSKLGNGDLVVRSSISFSSFALVRPAMWQLQSDFAHYTQAKAKGLALALQKNPKLGDLFEDIVTAVDNWTKEIGLPFPAVRVKQAIISNPGDVLVLKLGRKPIDD